MSSNNQPRSFRYQSCHKQAKEYANNSILSNKSTMALSPIWTAFLLHTVFIIVSLQLAAVLPSHSPAGFINKDLYPITSALEQLIKWDAHWYTHIAQYGYDTHSVVFFPAIIIGIKLFSFFGLSYAHAGLLLCNVFALISFKVMYTTFRLDFSEKTTARALIAYAVMPTSFFLNSIYTESLFIVFSLACIYYTRQKKWWIAGLFGAVATLTRNLGICLFLYLIYEFYASERHYRPGKSVIALFLPPSALLTYMLYNQYITGDPVAFLRAQQGWGRYFNFPLSNFWNNIDLTFNGNPYVQPGATLDTFLVLLAVIGLSVLSCSEKFWIPRSYLIIGWIWFIIPLTSTSAWLPLYSASRFILVIFPLYLFLAQLRNAYYYTFIMISSISLLLCGAFFINWYWVG